MHLAELALEFAVHHLKAGRRISGQGVPGRGLQGVCEGRCARHFATVATRKPEASRDRSSEMYLLGQG